MNSLADDTYWAGHHKTYELAKEYVKQREIVRNGRELPLKELHAEAEQLMNSRDEGFQTCCEICNFMEERERKKEGLRLRKIMLATICFYAFYFLALQLEPEFAESFMFVPLALVVLFLSIHGIKKLGEMIHDEWRNVSWLPKTRHMKEMDELFKSLEGNVEEQNNDN